MSDHDADLVLIKRCANGDEAALRSLLAKYQSLAFGLAKRYLGNVEDAEEIAIRAFLKVWKSASSFRGECSVKAYVCQITINLCRDHPRTKSVPERSDCPTAQVYSEVGERIFANLQYLPSEDRELLILYYIDEFEYEEICGVLGIGYDALKTRLVRARKRLRVLLEVPHE